MTINQGTLSIGAGGSLAVTEAFSVASGAAANVTGSLDLLGDGSDPSSHLSLSNAGTLTFSTGTRTYGNVDGGGRTIIAAGTRVTTSRIRQDELVLDGNDTTEPLLSPSFAVTPAAVTPTPEPSTILLLSVAVLAGVVLLVRQGGGKLGGVRAMR